MPEHVLSALATAEDTRTVSSHLTSPSPHRNRCGYVWMRVCVCGRSSMRLCMHVRIIYHVNHAPLQDTVSDKSYWARANLII